MIFTVIAIFPAETAADLAIKKRVFLPIFLKSTQFRVWKRLFIPQLEFLKMFHEK